MFCFHLVSLKMFFLLICSNFDQVFANSYRFICPKNGRWPHPIDCERYFTCNGSVAAESWCGHGMTYDIDHERCELSKNIDCKYGERPNWTPPEGWQTEKIIDRTYSWTTTTTPISSTPPIASETKSLTRLVPTIFLSTTLFQSRILTALPNLVENGPCVFQGSLPDPSDCQAYFICKENLVVRFFCPDRHLFDEDLRSCNDYRKVYCANRPSFDHANDSCSGQPNGWYPEYGNHCRSYYLCTEQRKTKMGDCPIGSKWNIQRLRCDDPRYLAPPCGYRHNRAGSSFTDWPRHQCKLFLMITHLISYLFFHFSLSNVALFVHAF